MPREELEDTSALSRLRFGTLFIKQRLSLTDEQSDEQIRHEWFEALFLDVAR
jgi:hypothetical protein